MTHGNKKILIIGGRGQVGWELQRSVAPLGNVVTLDRQSSQYPIDLTQHESIENALCAIKPSIIINASAYTQVDKAESEPDLVQKINADAMTVLSEQANNLNALLVHYSTDYVFDGKATQPYLEDDQASPLNVYGASKLAGDLAIQEIANNYLIFRTSWVYTHRANNFMLTMLRLAKERTELNIIDDQIGSPTWSRLIADVTAKAIYAKCNLNKEIDNGLYNLSSNGETSWFGFAKKIFEYAGPDKKISINPICTADYPTPAERPKNTVLSKSKIEKAFFLNLPQWDDSLRLCLNDYLTRQC